MVKKNEVMGWSMESHSEETTSRNVNEITEQVKRRSREECRERELHGESVEVGESLVCLKDSRRAEQKSRGGRPRVEEMQWRERTCGHGKETGFYSESDGNPLENLSKGVV